MAHEKYVTEFTDKDGVIYGVMDEEAREELSEQKSEIDSKAPAIYRDASGDIVSFADGADGMPLSSCVVSVDPVQDLHGYDYPWPGGGSKNLVLKTITNATIDSSGKIVADTTFSLAVAAVENGETYTLSNDGTALTPNVVAYYDSEPVVGSVSYDGTRTTGIAATFTASYTGYICMRYTTSEATKVQLEKGSTVSDYVSYSNICPITGHTGAQIYRSGADTSDPTVYPTTFPDSAGTVYGGELTINEDGTGQLVVDRAMVDLGTLPWSYDTTTLSVPVFRSDAISGRKAGSTNLICDIYRTLTGSRTLLNDNDNALVTWNQSSSQSIGLRDDTYTNVDDFKAAVTGHQLVYELATPLVYSLTDLPTITTLPGTNNIWSDTGAVSLTYPADTKTYVDSEITAATDPDANVVTVTGSTPTITGASGKRYVCGTVASISITPPGTGIIDVVFTSGTTPAVLTVPNTVRWANGFDPTSLDASTTYEINIQDGTLGVVGSWT